MYKKVHVAWHNEFLQAGRAYYNLHYDVSAVIHQKEPYSASKQPFLSIVSDSLPLLIENNMKYGR